jgi:PhoH-like ATPase
MLPEKNQTFVLDTNVILHHADSIFSYPNAKVMIPLCVVNKLDDFKGTFTSLGKNAGIFLRRLEDLGKKGSLKDGVVLENNAKFFIYSKMSASQKLPFYFSEKKTSNQVLLTCLSLLEEKEDFVLVSNDSNLRIRAKILGIQTQPFEKQTVIIEDIYSNVKNLEFEKEQWEELQQTDAIECPDLDSFDNQYYSAKQKEKVYLFRYLKAWKRLVKIDKKKSIWNIKSKNLEQASAIDLLLNEKIFIVFLAGKAGTGKTLLALASAIEQLFQNKYKKVLVSRPFIPMGRDVGFLPGTLMEKMSPWMQPLMDALEFIASYNSKGKHFVPQEIIDKQKIELEALTYIRGRSIPNRFILIDEAQNLTPHEIKTIITRVGDNSKIVFTGDPYQIDNPYVDTYSNGLSYAMEKFKNSPLAGQVFLTKGERSKLAEMASNLL